MLPKKSVEDVLHVTPNISDRMMDAIQLWSDMYEGNSPWLHEPTVAHPIRIASLGLPALIASEKARMATLEMKSEVSAPMETVDAADEQVNPSYIDKPTSNLDATAQSKPAVGNDSNDKVSSLDNGGSVNAFSITTKQVPVGNTARADFINKNYQVKCIRPLRRHLEYGIAKGGLVIKPYPIIHKSADDDSENTSNSSENTSKTASNVKNDKDTSNAKSSDKTKKNAHKVPKYEFGIDFIQADRFFPLTFDANEKVIEACFIQTKVDKAKERVYIRLEHHKLVDTTVTVQNFAFESTDMSLANSNNIRSASNLGNQIPLTNVPEWASLEPKVVIEDCDRLLFAYFRMPEANTVDPYSPLGVSGYSRVVSLIKDADRQYSRLLWEYEGGELAIDVDRDALKFVEGLGSVNPIGQERLFRKVDLNNEETYNVFAPALRDTSYIQGLNNILTRIEDATGLSRGTLSEVTSQEAKTATELKILKQRSYATNADIQRALQHALEDVVYVMDAYCTLYEMAPEGEYEVSFEWDDSIIVDSESELSKRLSLMQNGLAGKVENRMWYFGETENQAKAALQKIADEAMESAQQQAQAEMLKAQAVGSVTGDATQSPADTHQKKISTGQQADSLDNPDKSKTADQVKS